DARSRIAAVHNVDFLFFRRSRDGQSQFLQQGSVIFLGRLLALEANLTMKRWFDLSQGAGDAKIAFGLVRPPRRRFSHKASSLFHHLPQEPIAFCKRAGVFPRGSHKQIQRVSYQEFFWLNRWSRTMTDKELAEETRKALEEFNRLPPDEQ